MGTVAWMRGGEVVNGRGWNYRNKVRGGRIESERNFGGCMRGKLWMVVDEMLKLTFLVDCIESGRRRERI